MVTLGLDKLTVLASLKPVSHCEVQCNDQYHVPELDGMHSAHANESGEE